MKGKNEKGQGSETNQSINQEDLSSRFLNIQVIASYLGIKVSTIYSMTEKKAIPHYRVGRQIRFRKSDVDQWMDGQKEEVIDSKTEAKRVIRSIQKKPTLDIDRVIAKAIDEAREKGYNSEHGKPDRRGLRREEVKNGSI